MKMPPPTGRRMAAGAAAMMVCLSLLLQATGHVQVGDVDEYWAQRSQEAHLRDRGAQPLDQLVGTATRYRQDMLASGRQPGAATWMSLQLLLAMAINSDHG
ncbi:hypothetical protein ACP70R_050086 [Stipagrostis hirtigluma subsp. patula]